MTEIALRPYQDDCLSGIRGHFRDGNRRVILCAPTGAGKTVMFSRMVQQTLNRNLEAKVLILTDRKELLTQAGGTLAKFGIRFEPITAQNKHLNKRARCFVGMVETYWNRLDKNPWLLDMTLVIVDECHKGNFAKLFARFRPETFVIGATATPISAKKSDPLSNYYQAMVNRIQIPELVETGYLSECITVAPKIDRSKLAIDGKGEYTDASQMDTFAKRSVYDGMLSEYQRICDRYNHGQPLKTICFNVNVAHSIEVTDQFNRAGIPARHVDGNTPDDERTSIILGYQSGPFPVICNVGILNAGFDDPDTRVVIFNRATTSVSLWLQSLGRGSRIANGKSRFFALDMGNNWHPDGGALGLWDAERDWEKLWNKPRKKSDKEGVTPAKTCPECGALVKLGLSQCPYCETVFPVAERELATCEAFEEITAKTVKTLLVPDVIKPLLSKDRPELWGKIPVLDLEIISQYRKRHHNWIIHVLRATCQTDEEFRARLSELAPLRNKDARWVAKQEFKPVHNYQLA